MMKQLMLYAEITSCVPQIKEEKKKQSKALIGLQQFEGLSKLIPRKLVQANRPIPHFLVFHIDVPA
jgi:hypothetical protein